MSKKPVIAIATFASVILGLFVLFYMLAPQASRFIVANVDSEPVRVTAHWRGQTRDLGRIAPGKRVEFSLKDEAAMSFEIIRENGTGVNTSAVYFTNGLTVHVEISHARVDVKSDAAIFPHP